MNDKYITRFAPSPTGALHIGNARTFLITWLRARSLGGKVLMRMEDLDHPRVKIKKVEQAYEDLRWLGLDWDDKIVVQSQRNDLYCSEFSRLYRSGLLYPCFCSRADIQAAQSAPHAGEDLVYPNTCRGNDIDDIDYDKSRLAWRFNIGETSEVTYHDNFYGDQTVNLDMTSGDFVVARQNNSKKISISYQLACVVDDNATGVTEVIRAADLINSTFRQIELYKALGYSIPDFLHLPLVVGSDGRRLAKRHGDSRISCLREKGVSPKVVLGWLGWSCGLCEFGVEIDLNELLQGFDLNCISSKKVIVNESDLKYLGF